MKLSEECSKQMVPKHANNINQWNWIHPAKLVADLSSHLIPPLIHGNMALQLGNKYRQISNRPCGERITGHYGDVTWVSNCWLSGKLWYLQHIGVGDTIVYH